MNSRRTTDELFSALEAVQDDRAQDLIKELQVHQAELEIQNRELRATQQQLTHSRVRYADLYDFSPIGYASLDEQGVIEEINITGGKLLADNPHKLIGRSFSDFVRSEDVQRFQDHLRRCRGSRKKLGIELSLVPREGPQISIELFTMATQDADRRTLQFRTAMIDITIRKSAEAAVLETQKKLEQLITERTAELTSERRQREDAQRFLDNSTLYTKELEANRLKDEFLALVSHELRTPLTPILGAIYKLRASRADDEDLQTALDMIERNAKAQARIVEELLDISRITTGKLDFNRQPTDLLSIIESAIEVVRPSTRALGINLKTTLEPPPRLIWCDRDRIQQVIWNLLSNAIKFTSQGGTIEVRLYSASGWAHIQISDSGVGITPGFLPHVFDRFRQAGSFATRTHMGLGVGLSIVRYIVERHGGNVRADSRGEGHGATFVVDLPYS